jgi:hypothetical protein
MAMWRLAVPDKSPVLVSMLRKLTVSSDNESVSIHGKVSGARLSAVADKARHEKSEG